MVERTHRRDRARPGRARRAPAGGGRRRDLGRLRAGAGHRRRLQIGAADRPRRAVVPRACRERPAATACTSRSSPATSARDDFFTKAFTVLGMTREPGPRRDLPRRREPVRARLRARHGRQHQRAAGRRLPDHAHRRLPGLSRPGAAGAARRASVQQTGGDRASKTIALHRAHLRRSARFDPATRCVIHTHARTASRSPALPAHAARRTAAAAHAVLRDEGRPRAADSLPPAGRTRGGRAGGAGHRALRRAGHADPRRDAGAPRARTSGTTRRPRPWPCSKNWRRPPSCGC